MSALETPEPIAPSRQRKPRASDRKKTLSMIKTRWQSPDAQKKTKLARMIADAFDQVPPDGDDELTADGLGWVANVDWGGMNAGISDGIELDFNLATQAETYVKFVAKRRQPKGLKGRLETLSQLHKDMIDSWNGFDAELQAMLWNRRALGLGIFHFPHRFGWQFRNLHPCNLILPARAKLDPETWPWFAVRSDISIVELLQRFEDSAASEKAGWKMHSIAKAIEHFSKEGGAIMAGHLLTDPESYIFNLSQNDLSFSAENGDTIPGFTFYVKEWDGKISEYLLTENENIGWLFVGERRHDCMEDLISLHPLALGQTHIERIRGYGVKMLPFHDLENRVLNHACDTTLIGAGILIQGAQGDDFRRMQEDVHISGPFTYLRDGLTVQQQSFSNPAAGTIALRREFERVANVRNRSFGGAEYGQRESDESATGARLKWQERNTARTYEVARYYRNWSITWRTVWRRFTGKTLSEKDPGGKEAKILKEEMNEALITKDDLDAIKRVDARTIFGDGDPNQQFLALSDLEKDMPALPPSGQRFMRRLKFTARLRDPDMVEAALGPERLDQDKDFMEQRWRCQVEQNTFETSDTRVDLQDDDNQVIHCGEHTIFAEEVIMRVDEGKLTEQDAIGRLSRAKAHIIPHLNELSKDEIEHEAFKDFSRRWANIDNRLRQMSQHVMAQQEKAAQLAEEEKRNPKPSVKDMETILTEQAKRAAIAEESKMKAEQATIEHEARMRVLASGSTLEQSLKTLKAAEAL